MTIYDHVEKIESGSYQPGCSLSVLAEAITNLNHRLTKLEAKQTSSVAAPTEATDKIDKLAETLTVEGYPAEHIDLLQKIANLLIWSEESEAEVVRFVAEMEEKRFDNSVTHDDFDGFDW